MFRRVIHAFLVILITLSGIALAQSIMNNRTTSPQNRLERTINEMVGQATPIQEGVMTERQKKHSKIFRRFESSTQGKKLSELVAERGDVYLIHVAGDGQMPMSFDLSDFLHRMACEADAVVIGKVTDKTSQIIEEGTFVFTDYELTVADVLKNNAASPIGLGSNITYSSPGGAVELNGHTIRAVDQRSEPLRIGETYLLYLKYIPDTGAYKGFSNSRDGDSFQIKNGIITQISSRQLPLGTKRTIAAESFLTQARIALNQSCGN